MTTRRLVSHALAGALLSVSLTGLVASAPMRAAAQAARPSKAITWPANRAAIEQCLRTFDIERFEDIPIGITKPKRAYFKPGAAVRSGAWKPLMPGRYSGFWESYKSEIAAYEMDKLLGLDMVPPAVERRIGGQMGALVMWVEGVRGWDPAVPVSAPDPLAWSLQVIRMKMFDQLIGNIDRNKGNLLYDDEFHLVLIDHSRAFTTTTDIRKISQPTRIDATLWDRTCALTLEDLQRALGKWIGGRETQAILKRRDRMQAQIDEMVKERGEASVFIR